LWRKEFEEQSKKFSPENLNFDFGFEHSNKKIESSNIFEQNGVGQSFASEEGEDLKPVSSKIDGENGSSDHPSENFSSDGENDGVNDGVDIGCCDDASDSETSGVSSWDPSDNEFKPF
jgi:hypothetical protein